ncbi:uncharacterized protein LOC133034519 [Cannabis sativa]|uniref:uncharacterized protein LOC133034519 n=1 Tax=Cannabis sativa TaxID=3483 RepID=UPI0029C9B9E0|nr:uncharacterized protein LOC133034519 [Cannabis sativa]
MSICRLKEIGVGALVETKVKGEKVKDMVTNKMVGWDFYSSPTIEGRLLVIWKKIFARVIVIEESTQYVHCYVKLASHTEAFYVTFVYGLNGLEERKEMWKGLTNSRFLAKPWIVLGDFNSVINLGDRIGGKSVSRAETEDFNQWLSLGLVDTLKRQGSYFTWSNNQGSQGRIYSRIDHAFKNEEWIDLLPNSVATFSWEEISDHCAIVVSSAVMVEIGVRPFRFYNYWGVHRDFKKLVLESWVKPVAATGLLGVWLKLARLKHVLKAFNHARLGSVEQNFQRAKDKYLEARMKAQEKPGEEDFVEAERVAAEEFHNHEKMLKSYLVQRSKVTLLNQGDGNTAYFYACIKKRREENRIASFVNSHGIIVENYTEVVAHFIEHFKSYMGSFSTVTRRMEGDCLEMGNRLSLEQ